MRTEIDTVTRLFTESLGYERVALEDKSNAPSRAFWDALNDWLRASERRTDDLVVFYYSGHGAKAGGRHYLLGGDFNPDTPDYDRTALATARITDILLESRTTQLLLLLDTCYSVAGLDDLSGRLEGLPTPSADDQTGGFYYVSAARKEARMTIFADALVDAVAHVADEATRKSPEHSPEPLDVLRVVQVLKSRTRAHGQQADSNVVNPSGRSPFFPNPRSRFIGRTEALSELREYVTSGEAPAPHIVTGTGGSGKSALLAQLVADDSIGARAAVSAADRTVGRLAAEIGGRLGRIADLEPNALAEALASRQERLVLVVDDVSAIDRKSENIARWLIEQVGSAASVRLVIGGQRLPPGLMSRLREINLDAQPYADPQGVEKYVERILVGADLRRRPTPYAEERERARTVARAAVRSVGPNFLLARLLADQLVAHDHAVNVDIKGWEQTVRINVDNVLAGYLQYFENEGLVRAVLRAQAFARGDGLRDLALWASLASALSDQPVTEEGIQWVIANAGNYLAETPDAEGGTVGYQLRPAALASYLQGTDTMHEELRVVQHLLALAPDAGDEAQRYLASHLSAHAAAAGGPGWQVLAAKPGVLDRLDPLALAADAWGAITAPEGLPAEIVAVIDMHRALGTVSPEERGEVRRVGLARTSGVRAFGPHPRCSRRKATWRVRSAVLRQRPIRVDVETPARISALTAFPGRVGEHLLAAGCEDSSILVWDTHTCGLYAPLHGRTLRHTEASGAARPIEALCGYRIDEAPWLASIDRQGTLRLWDLAGDSRPPPVRTAHGVARCVVAYEGDAGPVVATSGDDGRVCLFNGVDGTELRCFPTGHRAPVRALATYGTREQRLIVTAGEDGEVRAWNPADTTGAVSQFDKARDWLTALSACGAGDPLVAAASADQRLWLWRPTSDAVRGLDQPDSLLSVEACLIRGRTLALTGHDGGAVRVWDDTKDVAVAEFWTDHDSVDALAAWEVERTPRVATAEAKRRRVAIWRLALDNASGARPPLIVGVGAVACSKTDERSRYVTGGLDGTIRFWDDDANEARALPVGSAVRALCLPTSGDHAQLIIGSSDGSVMRSRGDGVEPLEAKHAAAVRTMTLHEAPGTGATVLVTAGEDGVVWIRDAAGGAPVSAFHVGDDAWVRGVAAYTSAEGSIRVAVVGTGRAVEIWDPHSRERVAALHGHTDWVLTVCAYRRGEGPWQLASAGDDEDVRIWMPPDRHGLVLTGHTGPVRAVVPYPVPQSAELLISGGADGTVRIWDLATGQQRRMLPLDVSVTSLAVFRGGILVGAEDGHTVIELGAV